MVSNSFAMEPSTVVQGIVSDEFRYTLQFHDGRACFFRRRFQDVNRFGGGSVMVLGAFSLHHTTPLYNIYCFSFVISPFDFSKTKRLFILIKRTISLAGLMQVNL